MTSVYRQCIIRAYLMSEISLPAIELFIPEEEIITADECARIAFNIIAAYGMLYEEAQKNFIICMNVTDRVDANSVGPDGVKIALRLRTAPMYCFDGIDGIPNIDGRDFGVALLECGSREIEEQAEDEYIHDEDFAWDSRIAIVINLEDEDVFVCDVKTGRELSDAEQMNIMFLLEYVQKNLQAILTKSFAENASETSRSILIKDNGLQIFDPEKGLSIHGYECSECRHGYGHCQHRPHTLN